MRRFTILALALAIGLGTAVSPFASPEPDGLERVAGDAGFLDRGHAAQVQEHAPARGYGVPGVADPRLATGLAGFAGTLLVFTLVSGAGVLVRRRGVAT
jgi:hypothetical protein